MENQKIHEKKQPQTLAKETLSKHVVAEFWGCKNAIEDEKFIDNLLREAAVKANATALNVSIEKFTPQGVTAVAILSESHLSIHTWPEEDYVALDSFTCGSHTKPELAIEHLKQAFQPEKVEMKIIDRGIKDNAQFSQHNQINQDIINTPIKLARKDQVFGWELTLNLLDCKHETICSGEKILEFTNKLIDLIDMKKYGEPFLERFAEYSEVAAGYSVAQMIETSLVSGHFSEYWNTAYINIFSCKVYDAQVAINFAKEFFQAKSIRTQLIER